jgi:biopolymer transport protein ExbB/TolQ
MLTSEVVSFLWQGNSVPGRIITLALVGLGGTAGAAALRHRARYTGRETRALDDVQGTLRRALAEQQPENPEPGAEPLPPQPVELHLLRERAPADTLIGERLAALARMQQARVKVNVDALLQMTRLRESASAGLAFPGYAVDLAMMLGMLGTFIGLCMMLVEMQGVVPGASGAQSDSAFAQAATSLGSIIASKKTAFVTTLIGLVCAITVSGLNFLLARAQSGFYERLERFTTEELLPATVPQAESETAMEKLSLQLSDAFGQLGSLAQHHTANLDRIEAMETAFGTIVENIRTITTHAARAPAEETAGAMTSVTAQLSATSESLARIARTMASAPAPQRPEYVSPRERSPWEELAAALRRLPLVPAALGGAVLWLIARALW